MVVTWLLVERGQVLAVRLPPPPAFEADLAAQISNAALASLELVLLSLVLGACLGTALAAIAAWARQPWLELALGLGRSALQPGNGRLGVRDQHRGRLCKPIRGADSGSGRRFLRSRSRAGRYHRAQPRSAGPASGWAGTGQPIADLAFARFQWTAVGRAGRRFAARPRPPCAWALLVGGIARKLGGANDRTDFSQKTALGVCQLIDHQREPEEGRATTFDQAPSRNGLTALFGPVIDQEDAIVCLQRALLNLQLVNTSPVVGICLLPILRARKQCPGLADCNETSPQIQCYRRSQDEAASLDTTDFRDS